MLLSNQSETNKNNKFAKLSVNEADLFSSSTNYTNKLKNKPKKQNAPTKFLKRTASEPKIQINDIWKEDNEEYLNIKPIIAQNEKIKEIERQDSPYNEIYFSKYETLLREYLKEYKKSC
jgi:hypothetical protein